ncbi:protocadherin Fat 4 [Anguilla anguilla]|uniref:protocadherin Fat 4 n=1 Tax=Anguilla anguilla TaxID=7936 RepID=UPI0015A8C34B|nr:protocadherin Fat 4 [Anguilla anguilla]
MDTCYFRIRYITLMFYWMDFNSVVIYSTPYTRMPAAGRSDGYPGDRPGSTVESSEPRTPPLPLKTPGDTQRLGRASIHPRNRQLKRLAFSRSVYSFQVTEDTPPGTTVGRVSAAHADGTGPVVFSVLEDDGDGLFLLSPRSGEFFLSRGLDYERERYYALSVGARRGPGQLAGARVYFSVADVNDNAPVLRPDAYATSVLENSPVGTCLLALNASDADDGVNAELSWAVIAGDEEAKFSVNIDGVVCLQGALDREKVSTYNLTIWVSDLALPVSSRLTSTATVAVRVQDVNDNAPSFTSPGVLRLPEDTPLHAVVMVIHAADADSGRSGEVEYGLEGPSGGTFRVDGARGRLFLEEPLDREAAETLVVLLTARDRGSPRRSASMNLTVLVEDVNDNDPAFPRGGYGAAVSEDVSRGTSVLQVHARDPDAGPNGRVRYRLSHSHFSVDPVRGVVTVTGGLDREKSPSYVFSVVAADQGDPPRSAAVVVNVTVTDVNDCAPLLTPESITLSVPENTPDLPQVIHQVLAVDEDLGVNSQLTFSIAGGNEEGLFSLSPDGTLRLLRALDREWRPRHTLRVAAVDSEEMKCKVTLGGLFTRLALPRGCVSPSGVPPLTGTATVLILVDDLNDNRPAFARDALSAAVYEDVPVGTVIATVTALDPDDGVNGQVRYALEEGNAPFSIDETSGAVVTTGALDREAVGVYVLTVTGSDLHPTHPLASSATVTVLVLDVNDHRPRFLNSPYVANVPDTVAAGSVVCVVRAVDADTGRNAELTFSLFGHNTSQLSISPSGGEIFTLDVLGGPDDITVGVRVEDGGDDPKDDTTTVTVRFQNASEFPVVTVDARGPLLSENEPLHTLVAVVTGESNRTEVVSYYLASGRFAKAFQLHPETGELTLSSPLDYEASSELLIWVEARDAGLPPFSSYAAIRINVSDVNDNSPVFTQSVYRCETLENSHAGPLCEVSAADADSGIYGEVRYSILSGNVDNAFSVDSDTGVLRTVKILDREKISDYNLTIRATDTENDLNTGTAAVLVVVLDANDNAPRFSQIFFTEIPEDTAVGFTAIRITATDGDAGANALIVYTIIDPSGSLPFAIDGASGNVVVVRPLDRETRDRYVVRVNANDSAWSVSTDVIIEITDVNDNKPAFSRSSYHATVTETKTQEVFVTQVHATDADLGSNGQILYFIEPPSEFFGVNVSTGDILTKQPISLRDSDARSLSFTVLASDCGPVPYYSNATVTVTFVRYNYYPPDFLPFRSLLSIPFNLDVGTRVIRLSAVDQESRSVNGSVEYAAGGGNGSSFFEVEASSGWVVLTGSLRQSLNAFLTLSVAAKDKGVPPLSSRAAISFLVTGENRFAPRFPEPWVAFSVPEDLPPGSVVGKVQAEDEDDGANGLLHYSFDGGNEDSPFSIGQSTGLVTLIGGLDSEEHGVHFLRVSARDGGWIPRAAKMNVTVNVTDVNDNPPVFSAAEYVASVQENSPIGTTVLQVKATDKDSGVNAQISYSLVAGHIDVFSIDSRDGTLTTLEIFDYELQQNFEVTIKASDSGSRQLFSVVKVRIQIKGVNEFKPTFQKKQYDFSVSERSPNRTRVGKVSAADYDLGPDGDVFYLLVGQSKRAGFVIGERSGEILTTGDLRQHGHSQTVLRILAKNWGSINGSDIDETTVLVNVTDANDPPEFSAALYAAEVSEDVAVGTFVTRVTAKDEDLVPEWSRFVYNITSGNENGSFALDPVTGIVSVSAPLDREQRSVYNLTVVAIDGAFPPAAGSASVVVTVSDVNDNPPRLISATGYVRENQPRGTVVCVLNASDADLPANGGPFAYWMARPAFGGAFSLSPDGVLSTAGPVDRERNPAHSVLVVVRDAGTPPLSSTATVRVEVLDENDNPSAARQVYVEVKYYGSAFRGGLIGNVQPEDPDQSDLFDCSVRSGPGNMFSFPFGGCDLWSAPYQGETTYNITVEANDLLHPSVNNSVYVSYKGFTNASMDNCVLFYLTSPAFEEFLSFSYLRFVKALDSLFNLQASKTHVFGVKNLGDKILLLAAVKTYNGQFLSGEVASGISAAQERSLEAQSGVEISHITGDPCSVNPCHNGATCTKNIHIGQDIAVLESPALMFVSPKRVEIFNCSCPPGFWGPTCDSDVDECDGGDPCRNGGTCVNHPGGFRCHCGRGFTGQYCHSDVDECRNIQCHNGGTCLNTQGTFHCSCSLGYEGEFCDEFVDPCTSSPCVQGSCKNHLTGYVCDCPFGVGGAHCEEESYGFQELSFMEFPPLDPRNNIISLELATVKQDSLLLYNRGHPHGTEFLALEVVGGRARLSFDLGSGVAVVVTTKPVADGSFHSITARRTGKAASLRVDSCSADEPGGFCSSRGEGPGSERTLDVGSSNMTFGGTRSLDAILLRPARVRTHDFVGCVRNAKVNNIPLDPSRALASYNVVDRCPRRASSLCDSGACRNGGVCRDHWSHHTCECGDLFTGTSCQTEVAEDHALRLNGQAYIEYVVKESYRRDQRLKDWVSGDGGKAEGTVGGSGVEVKLRTAERDGALLFISGRKGRVTLRVTDGRLLFTSNHSTSDRQVTEVATDVPLLDGRWHTLRLFGEGPATVISLDGLSVLNTTESTLDLTIANVHRIVLGGDHPGETTTLQQPGFSGCVRSLRFGGRVLPFSGFSEVVEVRPSPTLAQGGCGSAGACVGHLCSEEDVAFLSCLSRLCPNGGVCLVPPPRANGTCACLRNVTDGLCKLCPPGGAGGRGVCPAPQAAGAPVWIAGAVLPATFVMACLALLVFLLRRRAVSPREKRRGGASWVASAGTGEVGGG